MSIWGIIIGGAAGFALGGPIGGLLGAVAGHAVESKFNPSGPDPQATKRIAFTVAVIALSAKMAKADGVVTRDEITAFRARVHIPPAEVKQVGRFWGSREENPERIRRLCQSGGTPICTARAVLEQLMDLLFHIAQSDGDITAPELSYLAKVADIFGFEQADFDRLLALHQSNGPSPYEVLGVQHDIDDQALRNHWKHLARTHHPDKLTADGMPEEFIAAANDRLAKINAAYDAIARLRGL